MTTDIPVATIFSALSTLVIMVIGWMLRGVYADFKAAMEIISTHRIDIAVLKEQMHTLRADIDAHIQEKQ